MIYTITLNPALDRTITVKSLMEDETIRVISENRYAGGKGIDVSRVIRELGGKSIALGFVGGYDGSELEGRLLNDGVLTNFIHISGNTRTNVIIYENTTKKRFLISAPGPTIEPHEIGQLYNQIPSLPELGYIVISGSIPPGVRPTIYGQLVMAAKNLGAIVALDADGEPMKEGVRLGPHIIKPNIHELGRLVGRTIESEEEIVATSRTLCDQGVETVIVSRGAKGLIVVSKERIIKAVPPPVEVESAVGAGDTTLAGFVLAHSKKKPLEECVRLACASGAATAMTPGTELCHKEDVGKILPQVQITSIS